MWSFVFQYSCVPKKRTASGRARNTAGRTTLEASEGETQRQAALWRRVFCTGFATVASWCEKEEEFSSGLLLQIAEARCLFRWQAGWHLQTHSLAWKKQSQQRDQTLAQQSNAQVSTQCRKRGWMLSLSDLSAAIESEQTRWLLMRQCLQILPDDDTDGMRKKKNVTHSWLLIPTLVESNKPWIPKVHLQCITEALRLLHENFLVMVEHLKSHTHKHQVKTVHQRKHDNQPFKLWSINFHHRSGQQTVCSSDVDLQLPWHYAIQKKSKY